MAVTVFVGAEPARYYPGRVVAVAAPYVTVRITDDPDLDGAPVEVEVTGTAALDTLVTVLIQPSGRATLMRM
jgi:hypothetical protein